MLSSIDRAILYGIFQPAVDRLGIDPQQAGRSMLGLATALAIVGTCGFAGFVEQAAIRLAPDEPVLLYMACLVTYGLVSAGRMRQDVLRGPIGRDDIMQSTGRLTTLPMAASFVALLAMVARIAPVVPMLLIAMVAASQVLAFGIAYLSVCDKPPPRQRHAGPRRAALGI